MTVELAALTKSALVGELNGQHEAIVALAGPLSESEFWRKPVDPGNSFGHLVLHLTGNLNHFAGARLGGTGYVRDRQREFTEEHPPTREQALAGLAEAVSLFGRVVEALSASRLSEAHPDAQMGTVLQSLIRMVLHFSLHRGQLSYIARLVHPPQTAG
jgi:hypothetical protein